MMLTQPTGMGLMDWADQVSLELDAPRLQDELDWQNWGASIFFATNVLIPSPYPFEDWKIWAERLCGDLI